MKAVRAQSPAVMPDPDTGIDSEDVASSPGEITGSHPIVDIFGDSARVRIVVALYTAPEPLNPDRIADRAGVDVGSWYNNKDALLETGLVEHTGNAGNSPLYAIREGDERIRALDVLSDVTVSYQLEHGED